MTRTCRFPYGSAALQKNAMSQLDILFRHAPSPVEQLAVPAAIHRGISLYIKRDELLRMGPGRALCGNKWRKLQYNLQAAKGQGYSRLLTFGGAYSNHIAAVAAAGAHFDFETVGIIRGERVPGLNPTLRFAEACGMQLVFVSRSVYRQRQDTDYLRQLQQNYGPAYLLPEGGTNLLALQGCMALPGELNQQLSSPPDYYALSVGTGGTMAGLISGLHAPARVIGFSALKGNFLEAEVAKWVEQAQPTDQTVPFWSLQTHYHFGGYAKHQPALLRFIQDFYQDYGIALDPIYTGKMLYGLLHLIEQDFFTPGSRIVAVHTGGLQGITGFNDRYGASLDVGL